MSSHSYSNDEMDAAEGLVSLSTDRAYRESPNAESDDASTDATTASSNWTDDASARSDRSVDGEVSSHVTDEATSTSSSDGTSSTDTSSDSSDAQRPVQTRMTQTSAVGINRGGPVVYMNRSYGVPHLPSVNATGTQPRMSFAAPPLSALVSLTSDDDVREHAREAVRRNRNGIRRRMLELNLPYSPRNVLLAQESLLTHAQVERRDAGNELGMTRRRLLATSVTRQRHGIQNGNGNGVQTVSVTISPNRPQQLVNTGMRTVRVLNQQEIRSVIAMRSLRMELAALSDPLAAYEHYRERRPRRVRRRRLVPTTSRLRLNSVGRDERFSDSDDCY